jgi:hypothetical protein
MPTVICLVCTGGGGGVQLRQHGDQVIEGLGRV